MRHGASSLRSSSPSRWAAPIAVPGLALAAAPPGTAPRLVCARRARLGIRFVDRVRHHRCVDRVDGLVERGALLSRLPEHDALVRAVRALLRRDDGAALEAFREALTRGRGHVMLLGPCMLEASLRVGDLDLARDVHQDLALERSVFHGATPSDARLCMRDATSPECALVHARWRDVDRPPTVPLAHGSRGD
jgi:hypothetical protein